MPHKNINTKRVILVGDEPAAISNLREVIDSFDALEVIAEIMNGRTAITTLDDFEEQLTADTSIRLHRGYIVMLAYSALGQRSIKGCRCMTSQSVSSSQL